MLSATLLALDPGLEGKSPAPSGAAGDLSRAMQFLSPSPTNEMKGGAQSCSLWRTPWWPFLKRQFAHTRAGLLPPFSNGSAFWSRAARRRPCLFWVERRGRRVLFCPLEVPNLSVFISERTQDFPARLVSSPPRTLTWKFYRFPFPLPCLSVLPFFNFCGAPTGCGVSHCKI